MSTVELNKAVPDFTATATSGQAIRLSALAGKNVVLYFYPKDNTPGCTQEGQDFRDLHGEFSNANTVIFGVSRDSLASHEKFKAGFSFPYELISDTDETLCRLFDVIRPKNMYGQEVMGVERSTFIIDKAGILRHEWRKVKVEGHAQEVLAAIKNLK